jgi:hypothetical protein
METATNQEWQRNGSETRVLIADRMFHLGQYWVQVVLLNPKKNRYSWWMKEASFVGKYSILNETYNPEGSRR